MSKKISIGTAVILMLLAVLVTFQLTFVALSNKYQSELNELTISQDMYAKLAAVVELYRTLYIGDIDEKTLTDYLIRGYVLGTGDKYAYYLDEEQFAEMMASNNAELQGIGIMVIYQNDMIEIISVMPDSPALEAGLEPGDIIAYVGGESVAELGYTAAVNRLQGEAGTLAEFTVQRGDELIDYSIERGYVNEQSVMYHVYEPDPTIGIVKILSFNLGTPEQFKSACEELIAGGVTKFVFDVRYNPGGDLESITEILDYLLPEGPIVRIVDAEGNEDSMDCRSTMTEPYIEGFISDEAFDAYRAAGEGRFFEVLPLQDYPYEEVWLCPLYSRATTAETPVTIPIK